jgi:hypothetical protein
MQDPTNSSFYDMFTGQGQQFADPFLLQSSRSFPLTMESTHDMCLFLYYMNPQYRRSYIRMISHFITRIDFDGEDGDQRERDELRDYLMDQLDVFGAVHSIGEEWSCYGNGFLRINFPFDRFLIDRRSGKPKFYALDMFGSKPQYQYQTMQYRVPDPTCMRPDGTSERDIDLPFMDRPSMDMSRITLRKLDPRYVDLMHSWISGRTRVVYRFEEFFIKAIKDGFLWQVNETPIGMLRAIRDNQDFLFNEDEVYHFKAPTLSGIANNGMGLPETIANFRALYNVQVYRKIDESVGLDYMLPFRLFSPDFTGAPSMSEMADMASWTDFMGEVIKQRRIDPFAMHAIPIPTRYQEAGGNGKSVTPFENIQFADKQLCEATGIPAELWQGTLRVESIPTTLRLFENTFHFILRNNNALLKWIVRRILSHQNREQIGVSMQLPSMADDLEERNVYLQLAAGGEITRSKAYRAFGVDDPVQEAKARMQEDIEIQKAQQKIQTEFQREQQLGSMDQILNSQQQQIGAGAATPASGGPPPATPLDILSQAEETAKQWLAIQSDGERAKAMKQVEGSNPNLYYAAKGKMEEFRRQGASQGRAQVGPQAQQAVQAGAAQ